MSDSERGVYVYCIVTKGSEPSLQGLTGVGEATVEGITAGELTAIISRVPLDEFGSEPLKRNLENLEWLGRTARAHDAVLASMMRSDAVAPMRLLTIFADDAGLLEMLERERDSLSGALARLRGHAEWSAKLLVDRDALQRAARERSSDVASTAATPQTTPGRAYFERKQSDRTTQQRARELAQAAARETHTALGQQAADARLLPAQNPELSGRSGEMVLNGAYLVDRGRERAFAEIVEQLRARHRGIGMELELTGPWAPYNFVGEAEQTSATREP